MLDLGHLPTGRVDVQIYNVPSTVTNLQWTTWRKPRGCTMVYMLCIGGGGGGGGGFSAAAAAARGGGGGGGSSGGTVIIQPALFVPDVLHLQVGAGGAGVGSGGGTAGSGVLSLICVYPDIDIRNVILQSGSAAAVGGTTGTGAANGTGGAASTVAGTANMQWTQMAVRNFVVGQVGAAGGAQTGAAGANSSQPVGSSSFLTMGGTGGGGTTNADFAGGAVNPQTPGLIDNSKPAFAPAGSNNGSGGFLIWAPFFSFPGLGGGASNAGVGGNGGPGGPGSGGGGGGGGTTGGRGGDGGGGLIVMISW